MKHKNLFIITLLVSLSVSAQNNSFNSFFPLAIGNKWIYQCTNPQYPVNDTIIVKDTLRINGKLYWALQHNTYIFNWYRQDNGKIFIIDTTSSSPDPAKIKEHLIYDFSAKVGDNWITPVTNINLICTFGGKVTLIKMNDTVVTTQKTFNNCFNFTRNSICRDAGCLQEWFAKGIGKVSYLIDTYHGIEKIELAYSNLLTGIDNLSNSVLVEQFNLEQNYPNPFNPTTRISFTIAQKCLVKLRVYDTLGRVISLLADGLYQPGRYEVEFNATKLPSGIYFYNLATGTASLVKKMMLLK